MLRENTPATLRCGDQLLDFTVPRVMGILNATPDSFYAPSRIGNDIQKALDRAGEMISHGASIIDIGGLSSRPGSEPVSVSEEHDRVIPLLIELKQVFPRVIFSIDTYRSGVARAAIEAGAGIINDISGGELDHDMFQVLAQYPVTYVIMHMRGTPATMQSLTNYKDLIGELLQYFVDKIRRLNQAGLDEIILDPGFGFSKTMQQNYELIRHMEVFRLLNRPLMIGISRKSTLAKTIERDIGDTLEATTALHMAALLKGARILRVHDVRAAIDAIHVYQQLEISQNP